MSKSLDDYLYYEEKNPDLKIYHGDCLEIIPLLSKVDLVVTDPPYGIEKAEWDGCYMGVEKELLNKARGVIVNCGEQNIAICVNNFGDAYRGLFYGWNRNGMTRGPLGYMNVILAVCGGKIKMGSNWCGFNIKDLTIKNHPCPKPIEYAKQLLSRFSEVGFTILDAFLGSGTTLVACKELNRLGIGIEINEKYCEIAKKRLQATTRSLF